MGPLPDLRGAFAFLTLIVGVVGWALIEFVTWLIKNLSFSWGA